MKYCDCGETNPPPWPGQYVDPWKTYKDYDPMSNSIPKEIWGGMDSNPWDIRRSELVWGWLGETKGRDKWWKGTYPDAKEITKWLINEEIGIALRDAPWDNVWAEGHGEEVYKIVLGYMKRLFMDDISSGDLAKFTAFFNPDGYKAFDEKDWDALTTPAPDWPIGNTVEGDWNGIPLVYKEVIIWKPGEAGFPSEGIKKVTSPLLNHKVIYYLDYK